MFKKTVKQFQYGRHTVTLENGVMARQASGSVLINVDNTVLLVTVVFNKEAIPGQAFFPLAVDYFEKAYAVGKIPGGYIKRETKPSDNEVLIARLIDRSLRPLFDSSFYNEVHVVAQVLSFNPDVSPDIPAVMAAATAVCLAGVPFKGPIAAARVGHIDGEFVLNPSQAMLKDSSLDLVVSGTKNAVMMIESEAKELPGEVMLNAINFGYAQLQVVLDNIVDFVKAVNPVVWEWKSPSDDAHLFDKIKSSIYADLEKAYLIRHKQEREDAISELKSKLLETLIQDGVDVTTFKNVINDHIHDLESQVVRQRILNGEPRIDGRDTVTVRDIVVNTGVLPSVHGSALFTRGETQSLGVVTLGTKMDEQTFDSLYGQNSKKFILHYNFPPFATGNTGRMGPPKRREVGHGNLAERALKAVLPSHESFPYTIRMVSEILDSNGSSSMASVCSSCLAMMDAGVPIKNHVAGVAMGFISDGDSKFAVLTDILGDEDHLGDMDLKVAGTAYGITALQMDVKTESGFPQEIMPIVFNQAIAALTHILKIMQEAMPFPNALSDLVPRIYTMQVSVDKIKTIIGKGGSVIRSIVEATGAVIDIDNDGTVTIFSSAREAADKARSMIEGIITEVKVGTVYDGVVSRILDRNIGVMVSILGGNRDGFVHISQISNERVDDISNFLTLGQQVKVKVHDFDPKGRMRLSIKAALGDESVEGNGSNIDDATSALLD